MAISINWGAKVIYVPKADLIPIGGSLYEMNIDVFRLALKDQEDDEAGMPFPRTHNHNPPVTVGGATLARVVEIINGYVVEFENGLYAVNLVGANSNLVDVAVINSVSIRAANSAGLTQPVAPEDVWDVLTGSEAAGTMGRRMKDLRTFLQVLLTR